MIKKYTIEIIIDQSCLLAKILDEINRIAYDPNSASIAVESLIDIADHVSSSRELSEDMKQLASDLKLISNRKR